MRGSRGKINVHTWRALFVLVVRFQMTWHCRGDWGSPLFKTSLALVKTSLALGRKGNRKWEGRDLMAGWSCDVSLHSWIGCVPPALKEISFNTLFMFQRFNCVDGSYTWRDDLYYHHCLATPRGQLPVPPSWELNSNTRTWIQTTAVVQLSPYVSFCVCVLNYLVVWKEELEKYMYIYIHIHTYMIVYTHTHTFCIACSLSKWS